MMTYYSVIKNYYRNLDAGHAEEIGAGSPRNLENWTKDIKEYF